MFLPLDPAPTWIYTLSLHDALPISVRPIITIDGEHEINDIFFDNVQVPVENLVGEENKGWTYAKFLLSHERDRKSTRLNSSHQIISYAVFCLKKKKK